MLTSLPQAGGEDGGATPALFCVDSIPEETLAAVVHELADWGRGGRGDLHQVQPCLVSVTLGLGRGHDAQLTAVGADEPNFPVPDLFVNLMGHVSYGKAPP